MRSLVGSAIMIRLPGGGAPVISVSSNKCRKVNVSVMARFRIK